MPRCGAKVPMSDQSVIELISVAIVIDRAVEIFR